MWLEFRAQLSGFVQYEREDRLLFDLIMNCQLEAVRKKSLHHQPKLVLGRVALCPRLDVESLRGGPLG
jgi:hypothetical protein